MVSYPYRCDYCNGEYKQFVRLNKTKVFSDIEISVNPQGRLRVRVLDYCGSFTTQDIINIKYCPACGQKFRRTKKWLDV